jgi:hypothetical protein
MCKYTKEVLKMIVKMNGKLLMEIGTTSNKPYDDEIVVIKKGSNKQLKTIAVTLWTLSGNMFIKSKAFAEGTSFYEQVQPLFYLFQDIALGIGSLALIAGMVTFVFKKRLGEQAVKTIGIIIGGVFLAPSLLMLLAIVCTYLNDALFEALKAVRTMKGE